MRLDIVDIDAIVVPEDRARQEFGDIDILAQSIKDEGIITPLAVMDNEDGTYTLLGGERRYKACLKVDVKDIPIRIYDTGMDELQMKAIELAENIYRKDFEWAEEVELKNKVHELYVQLYGPKIAKKSGDPEDIGWSLTDTADILGEAKSITITDINLANSLKQIPELAECKTKTEAKKLYDAMQRDLVEKELAKRLQNQVATTTSNRIKQGLIDRYVIEDFFVGVKDVKDQSVNIVEIDPPYAIDLKKMKKHEGGKEALNTNVYNEVDISQYITFMSNVIQEAYRVLSSDGWLILWYGQHPWINTIYDILTKVGFKTRLITGIWSKSTGQTMQPSVYLANDYETFFYARKDAGVISKQGHGHVFNFPPVAAQRKIHPTERPIELIEEILTVFGWTGCRVLVPFLGSGNTLLAAHNLNMDAFGYELSEEYKNKFTIKVHESPVPYKSNKQETQT